MARVAWSLALLVALAPAPAGEAPIQLKEESETKKPPRTDRYGDPLPEGARARLGTGRFRHDQELDAIAFSPDGKLVAGLDAGLTNLNVFVWDARTGKRKHVLRLGQIDTEGSALAFSKHGKELTVITARGHVQRWDIAGERKLAEWSDLGLFLRKVTFSADGETIVSMGRDAAEKSNVYFRDAATGLVLKTRNMGVGNLIGIQIGHEGVALSQDRKVVAVLASGGMRLWDLEKDKQMHFLRNKKHAFDPGGFVLSIDSKYLVATGGYIKTVGVWSVETGRKVRSWQFSDWIDSVAISPDKRVVAATQENKIWLLDVSTGKIKRTLRGSAPIVFSPDGKALAACDSRKELRLWNVATGRLIPEGHQGPVRALGFSADGKTLFTADGRAIRKWNHRSGTEFGKRIKYYAQPRHIHVLDADEFAGITKEDFKSKRLSQLLPPFSFKKPAAALSKQATVKVNGHQLLCCSPDRRKLAGVNDEGIIYIWDLARNKTVTKIFLISGHEDAPKKASAGAFSQDGKFVALGWPSGAISIWELSTQKQIDQLKGHDGAIYSLAFSPDGRTLVSGSEDATALMWDLADIFKASPTKGDNLSPKNLEELWTKLGGENAAEAYQAFWTLVLAPRQALPLLQERLQPVGKVDENRIQELIGTLADNQFAVRDQATKELEQLGELAELLLRKAAAAKLESEAHRRVENLLGMLAGPVAPPRLHYVRAIGVLEQIGTKDAKALLRRLAQGNPKALVPREAKEALRRMKTRSVGKNS